MGVADPNPIMLREHKSPLHPDLFEEWIQDTIFHRHGVGHLTHQPPSLEGLDRTHQECHEHQQDCGQYQARVQADRSTGARSICSRAKVSDKVLLNFDFMCDPLMPHQQFWQSAIPFQSDYLYAIVTDSDVS